MLGCVRTLCWVGFFWILRLGFVVGEFLLSLALSLYYIYGCVYLLIGIGAGMSDHLWFKTAPIKGPPIPDRTNQGNPLPRSIGALLRRGFKD